MTKMWCEIDEHRQVYVYWRGVLIYKRWPDGSSALFDEYGPPRRFDHDD